MKKLALVIVLAVVASRLLSAGSEQADRESETARSRFVEAKRRISDRLVRLTTGDAPEPPRPPAPPKPLRPGRLRVIVSEGRGDPRPSWPSRRPASTPTWFPKSDLDEEDKARPDNAGVRVLVGRISASEDRAQADLREILGREVGDWLAADVPPSWKPAPALLDRMALETYILPVKRIIETVSVPALASAPALAEGQAPPDDGLDKEVYTLYRAGQKLDFSPSRRAEMVETYRLEVASWRMKRLGGGLAAALAFLVVLTSYIRADVATKGYYTNRLRLLAAAGLGAAGLGAYRLLG